MDESGIIIRCGSVEDDWVPLRHSPFSNNENYSIPAVAVDWNSSQTAFHVTLLSIRNDGTEPEEKLWSDLFTISKIQRRHFELCLAFPELKSCLPTLPQEPQGIWGYIQWIRVSPKHCKTLEEYIKKAFSICGWKLFANVFFGEPTFFEEDYTITTLQLKRSKFEKEVDQALEHFKQYMTEKNIMQFNLDKLIQWHESFGDALKKIQEAERKLLKFDCEPYEELRDIAQKERTECAALLGEQSLTASTFQDSSQNFTQWEEQYVESVKKINEFRTAYFAIILPRLKQILEAIKDDVPILMENGYKTICVTRERIEKEIITTEINLLKCAHQDKVLERDKLRQDAVSLEEDSTMEEVLIEKEVSFYKKQYEIFSIEYEILDKNERIIRLSLKKLKDNDDDILIKENQKLNENLANCGKKKATLRNKMRVCEGEITKITEKKVLEEQQLAAHHGVQMKIDKRREDDDEKKEERLEERQKTLLRLKEYKKKYAKPKEVNPPRYQPPSQRGKKQTQVVKNSSSSQKSMRKNKDNSSRDANGAMLNKPEKVSDNSAVSDSQRAKAEDSSGGTIPSSCNNTPKSSVTTLPSAVTTPLSTITVPESTTTVPPTTDPSVPPTPPPPPPPPTLTIPMPSRDPVMRQNGGASLADDKRDQKEQLDSSFPLSPSSLSQETVNLDALLLARGRLKKQAPASTESSKHTEKGFPSGSELTRALKSVKLRKVVNEKKQSDLSQDGAEFLRRALERMNRFTTLSDDEDVPEEIDQEW